MKLVQLKKEELKVDIGTKQLLWVDLVCEIHCFKIKIKINMTKNVHPVLIVKNYLINN